MKGTAGKPDLDVRGEQVRPVKVVVKIGGAAAERPEVRRALAEQIARLRRAGSDVVVVHGGGKLLTQTLAQMGIRTEFANGLRVTDSATRDVALMVLAGMSNKQWVAEIENRGQHAIGICGGDGRLVEVRQLLSENGKKLGFVGRPRKVNPELLEMAFERSIVPVVASVALGPKGEYFNVNADDFAAAIADRLSADRLIYLTESGGVWNGNRQLLPRIDRKQISSLIRHGIVRDGMIPKLRSCQRVLAGKVSEIDIMSPEAPSGLLGILGSDAQVGTRIVK
jgi:acetylglutamate kinase